MDIINKTPSELAELRLELADNYSKAGELLVKYKRLRAEHYETFRKDYKSDAGWERSWELTKTGLDMMELEQKMRSIKMKMSAVRTMLDCRTMEARNQY